MTYSPNFSCLNETLSSDPILLLHGWGGSLQSLSPLQQALVQGLNHPIYNLELPGFGKSKLTQPVMSTHDYASFVAEFINYKKLKNIILIGHSFGGRIIIDLTTTNSDVNKLVSKIVLINASGIKPKNSLKKQFAQMVETITPKSLQNSSKFKSIFYKYILRERDYLNAGDLKPTLAQIVNEHYDDQVSNIKQPTYLIWGECDNYVPLWMGEKLNKLIKNSKLTVVPNARHGLPIQEPALTAELISEWLNHNGNI